MRRRAGDGGGKTQYCEVAGYFQRDPFVADIDADVVARRDVPAEIPIERVITVAGLEHVRPLRGCIAGAYG